MSDSAHDRLNRLAKWRSVFAGWQLGTRSIDDPECQAVRDHREVTILLRAEVSALVGLLVAKGVFTAEEWTEALGEEAVLLAQDFEKRFPGYMATDIGMEINPQIAVHTTKGWKP